MWCSDQHQHLVTAMDAARHGYSITIVEDCLGYQSKDRHDMDDMALRKLIEFAGCDVLSTKSVLQNLPPAQSQQAPSTQPFYQLQHIVPSRISKLRRANRHGGREYESTEGHTGLDGKRTGIVKANIKVRRPSKSTPSASRFRESTSIDAPSHNLNLTLESRRNIVKGPEGSPLHLYSPRTPGPAQLRDKTFPRFLIEYLSS